MELEKNGSFWRYKRQIVIVAVALAVVVLLALFTDIFQGAGTGSAGQLMRFLGTVILLVVVVLLLTKTFKMLEVLEENGAKLEKIAETLDKNRSVLTKINQTASLSDAAKTIAFRDADRQSLREAVLDKLQQQDYETTEKIIDEIAGQPEYRDLAEQLRDEAARYRDATDQGRINQVTAYIEKLFVSYQWAKASAQVERLIKAYPNSDEVKALRQELLDKKEERKKALLTAWDEAVKAGATDRSLEILRELDLYLTPNEGLALQEAARDVFRTKLHNLGVQFALEVSEKRWAQALETGQQIVRDFPNSRMAEEIRENWDVLEQKAQEQRG